MKNTIDTLILDLGGVLIDVDYERTARAFHALGFEEFHELYSKASQSDLFDHFEVGAISPMEFRTGIRELFRPDLKDREIDACWNAMLGSIPQARIELVSALQKELQVLLLSNTNAIHVPAFTTIVSMENGIADFKALFHGAYYSCEIGLRKPDEAAFHHVLSRHDAIPARTLFVDDSMQHVEGARRAGLNAEHLDLAREDLHALLDRLGFT